MDERGANIDLLFRNGLKDYEVLQPPEVWNNIAPAIKVRSRQFILYKAAALIAVLLTLSFFAYRWSREISLDSSVAITSFDIEELSPAVMPSFYKPAKFAVKEKSPVTYTGQLLSEYIKQNSASSDNDNNNSPKIASLNKEDALFPGRTSLQHGPLFAGFSSTQKKSFEIEISDREYTPEINPIKSERWSITALASPTYYSRFSSDNAITKQLAATEQPLISYSGGVAVSYKINKRVTIQTGLYYSSLGQTVDGVNSYAGFKPYGNAKGDHNFEVLTTSGTVYTKNADVFLIGTGPATKIQTGFTNDVFDPKKASLEFLNSTIIQNFRYLELPVVLRYKIIDKAVDINLVGGISYNLLVNNSVYTKIGGTKYPIGTTEGLSLFSLSSSLGMGMEYNLSNKISLNLEPTFRYYLNPFNEVTGSKNHPYSFGVFSGLSYKF